jgi:hypothetical protein
VAARLEAAREPLTVEQLRRAFPDPKPGREALSQYLKGNPAYYHWPGRFPERKARYWRYPAAGWLRGKILEAACFEPLTADLLEEAVTPLVHGLPPSWIQRAITRLKREGRLYSFRQNARIYVFGVPSDPGAFMRRFLQAREREARHVLTDALERAGVPAPVPPSGEPSLGADPELARLPISGRLEDLILQALVQLEHGPGVPVTARRLRRHALLDGLDRTLLDSAILNLRAEGKVILHGETTSLYVMNESERTDLVADTRAGKFFVEVARSV